MTFISVVPRDFVELTPLHSVLICLFFTLLCLWWGLVVISLSCILQARVSLALLLQWIRRFRVSLVLLWKFLLDFDNISIGRSK